MKWWRNFWRAFHLSYETAKANAEHGASTRDAVRSGVRRAKGVMEREEMGMSDSSREFGGDVMGFTTDPTDGCLEEIEPSGQQRCYLVLSDAEIAKGFVRPLRRSYTHLACGHSTRMAAKLCETYARQPDFYGETFCANCGAHFPLRDYEREGVPTKKIPGTVGGWGYAFTWDEDGEGVGS